MMFDIQTPTKVTMIVVHNVVQNNVAQKVNNSQPLTLSTIVTLQLYQAQMA